MSGDSRKNRDLYRSYLATLSGDRIVRSLRFGIAVVVALNLGFIWIDYLSHAGSLDLLLFIRLTWSALLLGVAMLAGRIGGLAATYTGCLVTGFGLIAVISVAGGVSGEYSPGLMLLFLGMPVLLPLTARQASVLIGILMGSFCAVPFWIGGDWSWRTYVLYTCFPLAAGIECVASCAILDRLRFNDFRQRVELQRARDDLEELDRAKSRFTANVHHELRTPLTLMLAPLEAIRSGAFGSVPDGVERMLRTMQSNGLRLLKLINDLLDLAKIESEQLKVTRVRLDLQRLVRGVVDGARPMADRKGLSLEMAGFEGLPQIFADADALEKVLVNLLGNALKFTEEGGIRISAGAEADGTVHFEVADSGIGIPPEQVGKVFDRFAQVDGSSTRRHEGTGIGLSLVQELVELHGGQVWAESAGIGHGACIHVLLPVGESDREEDAQEEVLVGGKDGRTLTAAASFEALASTGELEDDGAANARYSEMERAAVRFESERSEGGLAQGKVHPPGTPEVVIAEDNGEMRRLLALLIGQEYVVRPVPNGRAALEAARARLPQLVVTDVMMPEMSGTELCRALKSDPATSKVPVMLVTSKAESEMKIEGLELGADDYVTKPFHPRELMARVRSLVRLRVLQQEIAERNASLEASNAQLARALVDLKQAEVQIVQSERLAAVGELAAGVAHEVNNPLNFARNAISTLRGDVEELEATARRIAGLDTEGVRLLGAAQSTAERAKAEAHLEEISREVAELMEILGDGLDRTARLVADLRDFAAPHRGADSPVDVGAGLASTLQLVAHRLREAGARVELAVPRPLAPVRGDAGALNQVFLNLLKNAAEAIEGGRGLIHVSAVEECGEVRVRIRDDGPGMSPAVRERLFEPFFTTKSGGHGTGLGLSMCQRIVDQHGGRIEVDSEVGRGTSVTVCLPLERADDGG